MAIGKSLADIRLRVLAATRRAPQANLSPDSDGFITEVINQQYQVLLASQVWPHLNLTPQAKKLQAGERYYDFPTELDQSKIDRVTVTAVGGDQWDVIRGIGREEYNSFRGQRSEWALRWEYRWTDRPQFEVWPIPNTNDSIIEFEGMKNCPVLVNDTDPVLLDDTMLIMYVTSAILTADEQPDAEFLTTSAGAMKTAKTVRPQASSDNYRLGLGSGRQAQRMPTIIVSR